MSGSFCGGLLVLLPFGVWRNLIALTHDDIGGFQLGHRHGLAKRIHSGHVVLLCKGGITG